jgi:restriction endonuclease S subunit
VNSVSLGSVIDLSDDPVPVEAGETYNIAGVFSFGRGLFAREPLLGSDTSYKKFHRLHSGDMVLSQLKGWEGAIAPVNGAFDGWYLSPQFRTFKPDLAHLLPAYFSWFCRQPEIWEQLKGGARGMGARRDTVTPTTFMQLTIPLPTLSEQARVAGLLDQVEAGIRRTQQLRSDAKGITQRVVGEVINEALDKLARSGVPVLEVGDIAELVTSGPRNFGERYSGSGMRFYRAQDIDAGGEVVRDPAVWVSPPAGMSTRASVEPKDVLVVITGATIGRSAHVDEDLPKGIVSQHVGLMRFPKTRVNSRFVHAALQAPRWAGGQLRSDQYGQGKPGLNLSMLRKLQLPLPGTSEQAALVTIFDQVREKARALARAQEEGEGLANAALRSAIGRAFYSGT